MFALFCSSFFSARPSFCLLTRPFQPAIIRHLAKYLNINGVFKALADPTRRRILQLLESRELTAGELAEQFDISAPSMSHHFSVLKQADLIASRRGGQQIYYSLNTTVFQEVIAVVMELLPAASSEKEPVWKPDTQT